MHSISFQTSSTSPNQPSNRKGLWVVIVVGVLFVIGLAKEKIPAYIKYKEEQKKQARFQNMSPLERFKTTRELSDQCHVVLEKNDFFTMRQTIHQHISLIPKEHFEIINEIEKHLTDCVLRQVSLRASMIQAKLDAVQTEQDSYMSELQSIENSLADFESTFGKHDVFNAIRIKIQTGLDKHLLSRAQFFCKNGQYELAEEQIAKLSPAAQASKQAVQLSKKIKSNANSSVERNATGRLLCCDGSLSPSCFCSGSRRGCCSHHGGVCGCG